MRKYKIFGIFLFVMIFMAACSESGMNSLEQVDPASQQQNVLEQRSEDGDTYFTDVLPVRTAPAFVFVAYFNETRSGSEIPSKGKAVFTFNEAFEVMEYDLSVEDVGNIDDVQIYFEGDDRSEAGVVLELLPTDDGTPSFTYIEDRIRLQGEVTQRSLIGPLRDKELKRLFHIMETGNAQIRIKTLRNPYGEIIGRISGL